VRTHNDRSRQHGLSVDPRASSCSRNAPLPSPHPHRPIRSLTISQQRADRSDQMSKDTTAVPGGDPAATSSHTVPSSSAAPSCHGAPGNRGQRWPRPRPRSPLRLLHGSSGVDQRYRSGCYRTSRRTRWQAGCASCRRVYPRVDVPSSLRFSQPVAQVGAGTPDHDHRDQEADGDPPVLRSVIIDHSDIPRFPLGA